MINLFRPVLLLVMAALISLGSGPARAHPAHPDGSPSVQDTLETNPARARRVTTTAISDSAGVAQRPPGHHVVSEMVFEARLVRRFEFDFEGTGFEVSGEARSTDGAEHMFITEMYIDGELVETSRLTTHGAERADLPFRVYNLPPGKHHVLLRVANPKNTGHIYLDQAVVYGQKDAQ